MKINSIYPGDCLEILRGFKADSYHCCVTSPPYYGLRDYGQPNQIGLEETPEEYVQKLVEVFSEVRRVLMDDGTLWLNLGDSYWGGKGQSSQAWSTEHTGRGVIQGKQHQISGKGETRPSDNVSNLSNIIHSRLKESVLFFGSANPRGGSAKRIYVLVYDKFSPNNIFLPFFTSKEILVKNGQNDFCQIGNILNPEIHCFVSGALSLTLPNNANPNGIIDIPNNIGIIITTGDLYSNSLIRSSIAFSVKNSQTPFSIEITGEPKTELITNNFPCFDSITLNSFFESVTNTDSVNNSIPLGNTLNPAACNLGYFRVGKAGTDQVHFVLESGANVAFFSVAHLFSFHIGLTPYTTLWCKANKYFNYYQAKQEIGIPFMVRKALMEEGWICRQTIIWHKPNPMPESVTDRCTKSHEYIFLLSKSSQYYYDHESIKTEISDTTIKRLMQDIRWQEGSARIPGKTNGNMKAVGTLRKGYAHRGSGDKKLGSHSGNYAEDGSIIGGGMANKKSVWTVTTKPFKEAHFATYPEDLIEDCIKAGCPKNGIVLDPFMGAGTTAIVARKLLRNFVGIELNPEYIKIAEKRILNEIGLFINHDNSEIT